MIKKWLKKLFKKGLINVPKKFKKLELTDLKTGDIILFYHGNKLTELHGRYRRANLGRLSIVPYHAAMFFEHSKKQQYIVDPEITTSASLLKEYLRHKHIRIDIIRYEITQSERDALYTYMEKAIIEERIYDWKGYGSFVTDMPGMGWLDKVLSRKWLRPSMKNYFCSDFDALAYKKCVHAISDREPNKTSPADILKHALERNSIPYNPQGDRNPQLYTIQIGHKK